MSFKCALAGLPTGGGKGVIIGDPAHLKTDALLRAYARAIDRIGAIFATGEDVGVGVADCDVMREETRFVGGTTFSAGGDPSVNTADGVLHGLRAVSERALDRRDLRGVRVAVQGLGAVGWGVAERLARRGASLVVADIRAQRVAAAVSELGAEAVTTAEIHRTSADIFAPCALGGVITVQTAKEIQARAVAGAANNQLADAAAGEMLAARGILFAPDFVINAGGIIGGGRDIATLPGRPPALDTTLERQLEQIHDRLLDIFERAAVARRTPEATAIAMGQDLIGRA
jgi:leucine dehydrogenase